MNCMTLVSGAMKHTNQIVYLDFVDYILIRGPYVEVQVYTNAKHVYQLDRNNHLLYNHGWGVGWGYHY
jgi:hypothetical protein